MVIAIKRGLTIPLAGAPEPIIKQGQPVEHVGILGQDYPGLKPTILVKIGEQVRAGAPIFEDKKNPGILYTAPASGTVVAIHRAEKRRFVSLVIKRDPDLAPLSFQAFSLSALTHLTPTDIKYQLVRSGMWTSFKTRPYNKTPRLDLPYEAIFVTAADTQPHAPDPQQIIELQPDYFKAGLTVLQTLAPVHLCKTTPTRLPGEDLPHVQTTQFTGPHPAGLAGTHIHFLHPVNTKHHVLSIHYQDVIAIGHLFLKGMPMSERIVALSGSGVQQPSLIRTELGACISEVTAKALHKGSFRTISGSVLNGHTAERDTDFIGRFHQQISVIPAATSPSEINNSAQHSWFRAFISTLKKPTDFYLSTSIHGRPHPMMSYGNYDAVMPLDILPTPLLRALIAGDSEQAQALGCLELAPEDLALCTYVCASKYEFGTILQKQLQLIEAQG